MRQKIVAGNWKMNGQKEQITVLSKQLIEQLTFSTQAEIVVFPPAIYIPLVMELLSQSKIKLGAQNIHTQSSGAFTGEISAIMVKEFRCHYVLVGHSERRQYFGEDENFVAQKFHQVKEHGMIPVLCVGETLEERTKGLTQEVIIRQLAAVREANVRCFRDCVIAYEPVWAIGTGKNASPEQAQEVHQFIRSWVAEFNVEDAERLPLLYGGSVNESNAERLFTMPDVDGGLVGGASLNAKQFVEIVKCIN